MHRLIVINFVDHNVLSNSYCFCTCDYCDNRGIIMMISVMTFFYYRSALLGRTLLGSLCHGQLGNRCKHILCSVHNMLSLLFHHVHDRPSHVNFLFPSPMSKNKGRPWYIIMWLGFHTVFPPTQLMGGTVCLKWIITVMNYINVGFH